MLKFERRNGSYGITNPWRHSRAQECLYSSVCWPHTPRIFLHAYFQTAWVLISCPKPFSLILSSFTSACAVHTLLFQRDLPLCSTLPCGLCSLAFLLIQRKAQWQIWNNIEAVSPQSLWIWNFHRGHRAWNHLSPSSLTRGRAVNLQHNCVV